MNTLALGDLVIADYSSPAQKAVKEEPALVYDVRANETQTLYMTPEQGLNPAYSCPVKITNDDLVSGTLPRDYFVITERMLTLRDNSTAQKIGRVSVQKIDEILRHMAHNIASKHYNAIHKQGGEFMPGKTYIRYAGRVYDDKEMHALIDSALDFWLTEGRFANQFEKEFAEFLGVKRCLLTNSGSSANLLAISALTSPTLGERRLNPGDEVVTTACAFPTTVNPIIQNNLVPVFIDVDIGTYNIQASKIEAALSKKTKAIFLAHTLGNPFDLEKVIEVARKHNLWVIEDNCDALGGKYSGRYTGTFGDIATFSFYPPHHITMGEGGATVTNDPQLERLIMSFRDWGRDCWCKPGHDNTCGKRFEWQLGTLPYGYDHKYIYSHVGYNLKVTDMQAAVGLEQLKKLPAFVESRRENWKTLYKGLEQYEDYFILPRATENSKPSWFGFLLTVKENAPFSKNDIVKYLEKKKIATRMLFAGNIVRQPSVQSTVYRVHGDLNNTDRIMNDTFWVGVYPGLSRPELEYIQTCFSEFLHTMGTNPRG